MQTPRRHFASVWAVPLPAMKSTASSKPCGRSYKTRILANKMLTLIRYIKRYVALLVIAGLLLPLTASAATTSNKSASSSSSDSTNQVTQGYGTTQALQNGMIVKLLDNDTTKVEPVTTDTIAKMQGVVVAANDAAFALGNNGNNGQVFVATTGKYEVLVSNQNGPIKSGDYITISALAGIGMKV